MKLKIEELVPLNDRILIEVVEEEQVYKGALQIVSSAPKDKSYFGIVKRLGKEYDSKSSLVKTGDIVVFPIHSGSVFLTGSKDDRPEDRKELRVIKESELIGIIPQ